MHTGGFLFALHVPAHRSDGLVPVYLTKSAREQVTAQWPLSYE
jgi:hypothetical protein